MTAQTPNNVLPEAQRGPAEKLLNVILNGDSHLWRGRPGLNVNGTWQAQPKPPKGQPRPPAPPNAVAPGLFAPAAVNLYRQLLDIYGLNPELAAHFASYALLETEHRDLKVALAALMLVQPRSGQPVRNDAGKVEFLDDDFRGVGQGMILHYQRGSKRMLNPKMILRVVEFLRTPEIAALNRAAGFGSPTSNQPFVGRWTEAARDYLAVRESNPAMLRALVKEGFRSTLKSICRYAGYRPRSQAFFEILGWEQKQHGKAHRRLGLTDLKVQKQERFDGLTEEQICERIVAERLSYKAVMGRLPKEIGLTPAIMVAVLPSLSDRDLLILTPSLEELGLLKVPQIRERWEKAGKRATDQRSLNVARNVKSREVREKLEEAADAAVQTAVRKATEDADVHVMWLIDVSGSMEGAIEKSKEALTRVLAGFPPDKVHVASFNTMGTVLRPKAPTRAGVERMLAGVRAAGGTVHAAGVQALHASGLRIPEGAHLVVIVAGDESGEAGAAFAQSFRACGYRVAAIGHVVAVSDGQAVGIGTFGQRVVARYSRGTTVRDCARELNVPYVEVDVGQFEDVYNVPRVLRAMLEAPRLEGLPGATAPVAPRVSLWEKVMRTPLIGPDGRPVATA